MRAKGGDAKEVAGSPGIADRLWALGAKTIISPSSLVLGVMGAVPMLPHVAEVFILASEDQKDHPIIFARAVRKELYTLKAKYRRIQAVSSCDEFHARWLNWLGFEREGTLRSYGLHGDDMTIWGLV
jgi:hypothetical protein